MSSTNYDETYHHQRKISPPKYRSTSKERKSNRKFVEPSSTTSQENVEQKTTKIHHETGK